LNKFKLRAKHEKPDRHYIYNLKAIIVHSGSAEGGHYYTILRREKGWIKLDDSKVSFFSL
jgi:ubiquitin C-terminal hydrolase